MTLRYFIIYIHNRKEKYAKPQRARRTIKLSNTKNEKRHAPCTLFVVTYILTQYILKFNDNER